MQHRSTETSCINSCHFVILGASCPSAVVPARLYGSLNDSHAINYCLFVACDLILDIDSGYSKNKAFYDVIFVVYKENRMSVL